MSERPDTKYWDAKVHTHNPLRSAIMTVESPDKETAEELVKQIIKNRWPEEEIRELVVEPTVTTRAQRRKFMRQHGNK